MNQFGHEKEFVSQKFKGLVVKNDRINLLDFSDCTFNRCSFRDTVFSSCKFKNCVFQDCDLGLIRLDQCIFSETRFENSQLIGVDWTETDWSKSKLFRPVDFYNSTINHSTFVNLDLKRIQLNRCIARDVDFTGANLSFATCTYTDFTNSIFHHADLTEADFTGATHYTISANHNKLKKTKFSLPEAMSLLYELDIILTELQ